MRPTETIAVMVAYKDEAGNTYRVEQASNGNAVVVRYNAGGNRKLAKIGAPDHAGAVKVQQWLDVHARRENWRVVK